MSKIKKMGSSKSQRLSKKRFFPQDTAVVSQLEEQQAELDSEWSISGGKDKELDEWWEPEKQSYGAALVMLTEQPILQLTPNGVISMHSI